MKSSDTLFARVVLLAVVSASSHITFANPLSPSLGQVEIAETTFAEAIEYFRVRSRELDPKGIGANIIVDASVDTERLVSLHLSEASIGTALICLVDHAEFDYTLEPHAFVVRFTGKGKLAEKQLESGKPSIPSAHATRARQLVLEQIEFDEAPLSDVIQFIAAKSREKAPDKGINIVMNHVVDPTLPVTLNLKQKPASHVLAFLATKTGVEIRDEPWAIFIDPPGTQALYEARRKTRKLELAKNTPAPANPTFRGKGYTIGSYPDDPRSPAHPDYVGSAHPDVALRTNALNNIYKWVGGKWTFVRYGSGDTRPSSLDGSRSSLRTPTLHSRD